MSDWDAAKYHRISDPQLAWGRAVAERLSLAAGERILDLGCGTGRLTAELAQKPGITVVGLDRSAAMLQQARGQTGVRRGSDGGQTAGRPFYVRADGAALPFIDAFDVIFSAATFHWIPDHDRLFHSLFDALKPGGRVVAQCGGDRNLDRLYGRARVLMNSADYGRYFSGWTSFNHFENVDDTERRLKSAGFKDIEVSLVISPVTFDGTEAFTEFVAAVCLRHHLDRLPADERGEFLRRIASQAIDDDPPLTLDYWRLNIFARKGGA
jgi:trans-aconitate 2-methyltransferase